ncbi:TlpA family protein disulfide reductase [Mucilaginibacter pedocola]|uniref:AhpC/TSA family protein n=1 Tax=Mucilaginibacter pedocola TaxID=1792845 RepID=A0A1S9PFC6_9SPHI|nr:thioredoxin fold domain-containing protein [Mucilaginibacter pedocola]OOQ59650.1 AhpC/TSA family protein [Mucilaginibacter pedocola]
MKKLLVIVWIVLLFSVVGALFWYNELQYQLPTPVPQNYKPVKPGELVKLGPEFSAGLHKPLFLHFFNPACPCSKFNIKMFKSLVAEYGKKVDFKIVVISDKDYDEDEIQEKFGLDIPVTFDHSLAAKCGVYSTPQVALINADSKLYYRGNYNITRYCTDEKTNFAKQAINGLLINNDKLTFGKLALTSYGCKLTDCKY